jgi:eukaryotic-like serine/threonine-protein kinase
MKNVRGDDSTLTPIPSGDSTLTEPTSGRRAATPVPDLPGYQLGEVLGRGGMGEVVAAVDQTLGREVALKRMRHVDATGDAARRFVREAQVQALLDHPAIVPVHELGEDADGNPYFTMKRLVGTTLYDALAAGKPVNTLLRPFVDVCFAIQLAHERGIVHRDLKPSNIMLGNYGDVYVIDWGVARVLGTRRTSQVVIPVETLSPDATGAGIMLGTPGYMAPEQMKGEAVSPAADVYSLGAILFEILAGEALHPHGKGAFADTLARPTDSPARRAPDRQIAPELDELCTAALAEEPGDRPSARHLAEKIQQYLDGDRDLEQRRALAAKQLAIARAALSDPARRAEAGQAASRALALDPQSSEATALVTQLILEPPRDLPHELVESLEESERQLNRQRSRTAGIAFMSLFLFLPVFIFFQEVRSVPNLVLVYATSTFQALLWWHNGSTGRTPLWLMMLGNFLLAVAFSRLAGSFVLIAAFVCGQAVALATRRDIAKRPWTLIVWVIAVMTTPITLEYLGVIERTWTMTPDGILTKGVIIETVHEIDALFLTLGQMAIAVAVSIFAMSTTRAREQAQRRAHIQAWHMQQMIPRGAAPLPRLSSKSVGE